MRTLVLDGNYYLYRAYYASFKAQLTTRKGEPTGVITFFYHMIKPLLREQQNIIVTFDHESRNFRYDLYADYKLHRKPCPDDLKVQKPIIRKLCRAFGLPVLNIKGVEADDVLGTIAKHYTENEMQLTILTGDKDCAQFISKYVDLLDTKAQKRTTLKSLLEEKGLTPKQVTYFLAMKGDKTDHIPGVYGVGDVIALKLIKEYGTLKNIVANIDNIKGATGKRLSEQLDNLRLSYKLVKCKTDVDIDFDCLTRTPSNKPLVKHILDKYEIRQ